jgi:hypothetical protein
MNFRKAFFFLSCLLLSTPALFAQEQAVRFFSGKQFSYISAPIPEAGELNPNMSPSVSPSSLSLFPPAKPLLLSESSILPQYARENPANFAPLCRMELQVENQLPIGIWVNWEDSGQSALMESAHLRLRLLRF